MRALTALIFLASAGSAHGAPGITRFDYATSSSRTAPTIGMQGTPPASSVTDAKVSALSPTLAGGIVVGASFTRRESRNDAFLVAPPDLGGVEIPLSSLEPGTKSRAGIRFEQELGFARWSLAHEQDVTRSLVAEKSYEGSVRFGAAEDFTQYGIEFRRRRTDQPASRYVHPVSFKTLDRPGALQEERDAFFAERILAEYWKARFILHAGRVSQTRPAYSGLEVRQSFAVGRKLFPLLALGRLTEGRGDPFEDDRGDAAHTWVDAGASFQAGGRSLLKFVLTAAREEELRRPGFGDANANLAAVSVGWDYRIGSTSFALSARAAGGERGYSENSFQGGITWEFDKL